MAVALRRATPATESPSTGQLTRVEARRLARHPLLVLGLLLSIAEFVPAIVLSGREQTDVAFIFLTGAGFLPLGVGTFVAANLAALRSWRNGTDELELASPMPARRRTAAQLLAVGGAVAVAVALLAAVSVALQVWDGLPHVLPGGDARRIPTPAEFVQGPLVVALLGVSGVALARWVRSRLVAPLLLIPAFAQFVGAMWRYTDSTAWRFAPIMAHEHTVGWVQVTPGSGFSIIDGFDVAGLSWHLLYLAGLTGLVAVVALLRGGRSRDLLAAGAVAAALAAVGGVAQVL